MSQYHISWVLLLRQIVADLQFMQGMEKQKKNHGKNRAEALKQYVNYSKKLSKSLEEESIKIQTKLDKVERVKNDQ